MHTAPSGFQASTESFPPSFRSQTSKSVLDTPKRTYRDKNVSERATENAWLVTRHEETALEQHEAELRQGTLSGRVSLSYSLVDWNIDQRDAPEKLRQTCQHHSVSIWCLQGKEVLAIVRSFVHGRSLGTSKHRFIVSRLD